MKRLIPLAAALIALTLSGCASITLAPAGAYSTGGATYTLGRNWSDISAVLPNRQKAVRLLTIDGPLLNRLFLTDGLEDGQGLFRARSRDDRQPVHRAGASATEQVEFVADLVSGMDYQQVETSGVRRAERGGRNGVMFDITARTPAGLDISGLAQVIEVDGKLYVGLFLAPTEHYYGAYRDEAQRVLESFTL